ncbi:hairy-related 5 [Kryptolebias marmoratus]|uniref:hairy-related 5 n=1 Tax=Kryptolebias marmoratus TaxID=37003 RepID=UPI0007F8A0FB|nr:hairy-related 5 [Kryptolebias marmoratus]
MRRSSVLAHVSKPVMEKRRRERINHSLETLRLLMLENTQNEKLKNPKVERAEILESVVDFLKTEKQTERVRRVPSGEQRGPCGPQRSYQDGVRSCLLRVSQFIASKSRELEGSPGPVQGSPLPPHPPPPQLRVSQLSPSSSSSPRVSAHTGDPVWRPWPV